MHVGEGEQLHFPVRQYPVPTAIGFLIDLKGNVLKIALYGLLYTFQWDGCGGRRRFELFVHRYPSKGFCQNQLYAQTERKFLQRGAFDRMAPKVLLQLFPS